MAHIPPRRSETDFLPSLESNRIDTTVRQQIEFEVLLRPRIPEPNREAFFARNLMH